jgi:hypothetical protein
VLYYYANDVYYVGVPGGYAVSAPPTGALVLETPATPPPPPTASGPYAEGTWYYCESAGAYYPYVSECPEGWEPVPAVPRSMLARLASVPAYPHGAWYWCESAASYYPYVRECPEDWRPVPATPPASP